MNEESLSALLDGECAPSEVETVLQHLDRDPSGRARFARMALVREALRGRPVRALPADFADRIGAALAQEPAPVAAAHPRAARSIWRPAIGMALAAGVTAFVVLTFRPEPDAAPATSPVAASAPSAIATSTGSLDEAQTRQLRNYLVAYSQSRAQQGVGLGTLGYARVAAHSAATPEDIAR